MYSKPIISNGTDHELVGRNLESLDPNRAPTFQSSPTMAKGQKNQLKVCANNIKQAFIKIKKRNTLESNSLSLAKSLLWVQALATVFFGSFLQKFVGSMPWPRVDHGEGCKWSRHLI